MHLYHVDSATSFPTHIFATSFDEAVEMMVTWWAANGIEISEFSVAKVNPEFLQPMARVRLNEALLIGMKGIGDYNRVSGWTIRPLAVEDQ